MSIHIEDKSLLRQVITENRKQQQRKLKENQDNIQLPLSTLQLFDRILISSDTYEIEECDKFIDGDRCPAINALVSIYRRFPNMTLRELLSVDSSQDAVEFLRSVCLR